MTPEEFEQEVVDIFRMLGYQVTDQLPVMANRPDAYVVSRQGLGKPYRVLIECKMYKRNKIGPNDFNKFLHLVQGARVKGVADSGIMVSVHGCTPSVKKEVAGQDCPVEIFSIEELRSHLFDPRAYLEAARSDWAEATRIFEERNGVDINTGVAIDNMRHYLHELCRNKKPGIALLFGGSGTGKTTQLQQLAVDLAERTLAGKKEPTPIYVSLRDLPTEGGNALERHVYDTMKILYPEPTPKWTFLRHLLGRMRVVLLLDGLDEMQSLHKPKQIVREIVKIARAAGSGAKCLITCRSTLFESRDELEYTCRDRLERHLGRVPELIRLSPLEPEAVKRLVAEATGSTKLYDRLAAKAASNLCSRPILLHFLIDLHVAHDARNIPISEFDIIDRSIDYMLESRIDVDHSAADLAEWRSFLEHCAFQMVLDEAPLLERGKLAIFVKEHFGGRFSTSELRIEKTHARLRTLFDLKEEGLAFQHLIFRDFLSAAYLVRLLIGRERQWQPDKKVWLSPEILSYLGYSMKRLSFKDLNASALGGVVPAPPKTQFPIAKLCWVPPGLFVRGRKKHEESAGAKLIYYHQGFWITKTPVTTGDYISYMEKMAGRRKKTGHQSKSHPLTSITYEKASFLAKIVGGRLPTEDEWERAASWVDGSFPHVEQLPACTSQDESAPDVGTARPNPFGLYDASGCVWQWTSTIDKGSEAPLIKGAFWGASKNEKLDPTFSFAPPKPQHIRTGFRVVFSET